MAVILGVGAGGIEGVSCLDLLGMERDLTSSCHFLKLINFKRGTLTYYTCSCIHWLILICAGWGLNPQPWHIGMVLQPTELPGQGPFSLILILPTLCLWNSGAGPPVYIDFGLQRQAQTKVYLNLT